MNPDQTAPLGREQSDLSPHSLPNRLPKNIRGLGEQKIKLVNGGLMVYPYSATKMCSRGQFYLIYDIK